MKRVLIFVGLKVAEVVAVIVCVCGFFWVGRLVLLPEGLWPQDPNGVDYFACWSLGFFSSVFIGFLVVLLFFFIRANWNWAGELANRRSIKNCGTAYKDDE